MSRTKAKDSVFERVGPDEMSDRLFYVALAFFIIWGLLCTAVAAHKAIELGYNPGKWGFILWGIVVPFTGVYIAANRETVISFIGYHLITIPFGMILAPVVSKYDPHIVRNVCAETTVIVGIMGFAGMSLPSVFRRLGGVLFVALIGLVGVMVVQLFVPAWQHATWIDYAAIAIFSLYVGYDFHRASEVPRTANNALAVAVSLYLDILNIFLRLLSLKSKD